MFETLLVANRGEIACRILRTAHALGLRTVAVFSEADADARHVALADEAVCIGPAPARQSYLDPARLLEAARRTGAQAIHPGYGFLSEDAAFAQAVLDAGRVWVGPPPSAIAAMGDKARAKAKMREAGVPCVPGFDADDPDDAALLAAAPGVGFPLLVKAAAGGGGRGMRRVDALAEMPAALRSARAEAASAFGAGGLLLERLLTDARHIEVQIFADGHGSVVHLGERDCSVQRRHQKVIEEAPSPAVDAALRERLGALACAAARAVGYVGAGTVELLLDVAQGAAYFLEMNTRLQVEHPVTEAITGLDLVAWQLRVAAGAPLPLRQDQIAFHGHAIEARLYAEAPAQGYQPRTGRVRAFVPPTGPGVRCDHGLRAGQAITADYDPMLAKVIAHGPDRETARLRLLRALSGLVLVGVETNQSFLGRVLRHPDFAAGQATTRFLEQHAGHLTPEPPADPEGPLIAAALWLASGQDARPHSHPRAQTLALSLNQVPLTLSARALGPDAWQLQEAHTVSVSSAPPPGEGGWVRVRVDGIERGVFVHREPGVSGFWAVHRGEVLEVGPWQPLPLRAAGARAGGDGRVRALTAGRVLAVSVAVGDPVTAAQPLVVLEAMKLESSLTAGIDGTVAEVRVAPGDSVSAGQIVLVVVAAAATPGGE